MENTSELIKQLERTMKNGGNIDKYVAKLRRLGLQDTLIGPAEMSVLMYYVKGNQLNKVKALLEGEQAADRRIKNKNGINALALAFLSLRVNQVYDVKIIEVLLNYHAKEQIMVMLPSGSLLFMAVRCLNIDLVKNLLAIDNQKLPFLDSKYKQTSPLHLAIENNDLAIVDELLLYQPHLQVMQQNSEGEIPLHYALKAGNLILVEKLLNLVPNQQLKAKTFQKAASFEYVIESNNQELIDWLFTNYAWLRNEKGTDGFTPLHIACRKRNLSFVKILLQENPEEQVVSRHDLNGMPIDIACQENQIDIVEALLHYCTEKQIKHRTKFGNILHAICNFGSVGLLRLITQIAKEKHIDITELYLQMPQGVTPLMVLCTSPQIAESTRVPMIEVLLESGPVLQLEVHGMDNITPLMAAVVSNQVEVVKKITQYPSMQQYLLCNTDQSIPLFEAIKKGNTEIIKLLLEFGHSEQLVIKYKQQMPALLFALVNRTKFAEILKLLLPYYTIQQLSIIDVPLLCLASENPTCEAFLEPKICRVFINKPDDIKGVPPLSAALGRRNWRVASYLLEQGADIHLPENRGWLPLHYACWRSMPEAVSALIDKGAGCEVVTQEGTTPLHIAAQEGNLTVLKLLLAEKIALDTQDKQGKSALLIAVLFDHIEIVKLLCEKGVNVDLGLLHNEIHVTPLFYALTSYNFAMAKLLLRFGANTSQSFIKNENTVLTLREYVIFLFNKKPEIYEKAKQLFTELNLPSLKQLLSQKNNNQSEPETVSQSQLFSSRRYLMEEMGLSAEELEWF